MKFKLITSIIVFDIILIAFVGYMIIQHDPTEGGMILPSHQNVALYGILLDDGGVNGEVVGCRDSLTPVRAYQSEQYREVEEGLIVETIRELLALSYRDLDDGLADGAFYTAAYQPDIAVKSVEINGDTANVFLSGNISLGGVCDTPRFEKQLEATVKQFEGVEFARFYLNGSEENFRKALSGQ